MERLPKFGMYFRQISVCLEAEANRNLAKRGLTQAQAHFLMALHDFPAQTATLKEMEASLHVAQSTLVGIVARMEKKELLTVFPDTNDRRVKRVQLTDKGREHCDISREEIMASDQHIVSGLTACEQTLLANLLERIRDTLREDNHPEGSIAND